MSTRRTQFSGKLTPGALADFLKKNGRCNAIDVLKGFKVSETVARKYLGLAVDAGVILREKEGNLLFFVAAKNPKKPKHTPPKSRMPVLDAPSASRHLNDVWGWNQTRRSAA